MSDFYQNGIITNFHNLTDRPVEDLEADLMRFSRKRPMSLILPSLYSELEGPALKHIVDELAQVPYLSEIVIGLDRADRDQFEHAKEFFSHLPQHHRILWNDGPRLRALDEELTEHGLAPMEAGKGRNVWYCSGYVQSSGIAEAVALHDCDIVTYDRGLLARLIYPVAHPQFNYEFCKGYYSRIAQGKLNGRVARLMVTPLIRALKKVYGPLPYLDYLDSYRYPLSGEFSMRTDVLADIRIPSDWGLEIGVLSEVHRNYSTKRLCQVDIADAYDHKHQPLSEEDALGGLNRMSLDIAKAMYRKLATLGVEIHGETFRTIKATYYRIALDLIETYYNDAVMNGLTVDRHSEEAAVELFAANIMDAGSAFLDNPRDKPFIPSWNRVQSAVPDLLERMHEAVELDNQ
ncbi:glycosyl transferase [Cobetia marina]|jgi:glucosyl-3-phosphoglycerate synthase|uniref:Glycosyl transferase n=1 Tax=Cobetia marina TaxID=28258 RepID=A0ABU9GGT5_COBMA|nr:MULTISPECIES: glycosyl transferase [Cobetia]AOM00657.1 glycosyl transferase [Cobetia marina]AZV30743.1 glycosyl transferase [Cobetia sp. ICG0124]MDA5562565.1 glycosyl transferase [Cobetia sp. MMG027]MDH2291058.1 glycosyl transferase [Cobetia sp. 10Alg 146]MDH2373011.1 glycosyl transferase [Cobetia sp. 3AK]